MAFEAARAKAGAVLMDIFDPGWADHIDLETLDLSSCQVCVLGQRFGRYENGVTKLFAMHDADSRANAAERAGFCIQDPQQYEKQYSRLTNAWRREIKKRQEA